MNGWFRSVIVPPEITMNEVQGNDEFKAGYVHERTYGELLVGSHCKVF